MSDSEMDHREAWLHDHIYKDIPTVLLFGTVTWRDASPEGIVL